MTHQGTRILQIEQCKAHTGTAQCLDNLQKERVNEDFYILSGITVAVLICCVFAFRAWRDL